MSPPASTPLPIPILYSFRRCPYAMRARMALFVSAQAFHVREVVLRNKPQAMLDASLKGTVPVLVLADGTVIDESLAVMRWALDQNDPQGWLDPQTGSLADMLDLIARNDSDFKDHLDRYKYASRYENSDPLFHRTQGEAFLRDLETRLNTARYLFGNRKALADVAIAPFVRQFALADWDWFFAAPYPAVQRWLTEFIETPPFTQVMDKFDPWQPGDAEILIQP